VVVASQLALPHEALDALSRASALIAAGEGLPAVVAAIADAAVSSASADVAVVRVLADDGSCLAVRAVAPAASALAAELEGSRIPLGEVALGPVNDLAELPAGARRAAERIAAEAVLFVPALAGDALVGSVEVARAAEPFSAAEQALVGLAAAQLGIAMHVFRADPSSADDASGGMLELAGSALAAGADELRAAEETVRLAAGATRAAAAVLWLFDETELSLAAAAGVSCEDERLDAARELASLVLSHWQPLAADEAPGLPAGAATVVTLQLGAPPVGALQLFYPTGATPGELALHELSSFSVRAAHALRASRHAREMGVELERTRALLAVVGQAIARLSLAHTLETAVERIAELLTVDRVGVYLRDDGRLLPAAGRGVGGSHAEAAARLLDLALGAYRARGIVAVPADTKEPALEAARASLAAAGLDSAVAVTLRVREDAIGLLVAYPPAGRVLAGTEIQLLEALAAQLAVAVQNAQLHEQAKQLGDALGDALASERQAAGQIRALYEISRSFAQSLSLETTLDAVTRTIVEVLGVDAAVIRVPDPRRDLLIPHAVHVADVRLADAVRTVLERPQPLSVNPIQGLFRTRETLLLTPEIAASLGGSHALLAPFLAKGSTAALLPIATPAEVLASLTIVSLDPARPIVQETVETALSIAAQAALAIDNARLYQQQKDFADTMQRTLLPDSQPSVPGLELAAVYESAATVAVGGDVYDFLELHDGRLAVVVGDVTGHGIEATADMAMARFTFRSVAREHPEPADFLRHTNDVVADEIALGKFITMAYVVADVCRSEVLCASAGHPEPRVILPDGSVRAVTASGMALGIEPDQEFEEVRIPFPPGAALVLYTDGVIEARRDRELYGTERLDAVLADCSAVSAEELVRRVVEDCRAYGGELTDDVAVVAIKRTDRH
jgi:serine phosphatase RsbU (regulator of sigma subunit)